MAAATMKITLSCDVETVWNTVTSLTDFAWRSDLERIEVLSDTEFVEYTKEGYATAFTITRTEIHKRWEFDMENQNMSGHWTGIFRAAADGTEIEFTEEITAKKLLMKPFVKPYLKKQQTRYISDLKKALQVKRKQL